MGKRAETTKAQILEAAKEIFSLHGYHGARVDSIAGRAGVNKQRLYAYFGRKQDLFAAVMQKLFEEIAEIESQIFDRISETDADLFGNLLSEYMRFHSDHPYFWRLIAWENLEGDECMTHAESSRVKVLEKLKTLFGKRQGTGEIPDDVSFETFFFMITAMTFFYHSNSTTLSQTLGIEMKSAAVRERLMRESLRLLGRNFS